MSGLHHRSDAEIIAGSHNTARFFVENRQIAWVLLLGTVAWGGYGYFSMPQRKDPDIPARQAMVITNWPGASAKKVEELVTRPIEQTVASNSNIARIESTSRANVSYVTLTLSDKLSDTGQTLDDLGGRLAAINTLPQGAGPVNFQRDFGDTATLLLTVASPRSDSRELDLRALAIERQIEAVRPKKAVNRVSLILCLPIHVDKRLLRLAIPRFEERLKQLQASSDVRALDGPGFVGIDFASTWQDRPILDALERFRSENYGQNPVHPDAWAPFIVRDPAAIIAKLRQVSGEKYSYADLDTFTDDLSKALLSTARTADGPPLVSKVTRSGVLNQKIYLFYSQERLAAYGLKPSNLQNILNARNITAPGGQLTIGDKSVVLNPSGEFQNEDEIGSVIIGVTAYGAPIYLRSVVDIVRAYDDPPQFLNYYSWRDTNEHWQRTRAISISVQMGRGEKVGRFSVSVDKTLDSAKARLPRDLIVARASNQADQVAENIHLFMTSLYEAIALVVIVSLIGFWEWRSALLMALAIPITLLMTFGMMDVIGIDLQQVSIATLIIALGLLVDDPVVAGDAIRRDLAIGHPPLIAAWLGPTKLATAILFATVTNIVAYLPFLLLTGDTGKFLFSLPAVISCALIASRLVSMTFIPLLGYYLLRPRPEPSVEQRRTRGFGAAYYHLGQLAIRNRYPYSAPLVRRARPGRLDRLGFEAPVFSERPLPPRLYKHLPARRRAPEPQQCHRFLCRAHRRTSRDGTASAPGVGRYVYRRRRSPLLVLSRSRAAPRQLRAGCTGLTRRARHCAAPAGSTVASLPRNYRRPPRCAPARNRISRRLAHSNPHLRRQHRSSARRRRPHKENSNGLAKDN